MKDVVPLVTIPSRVILSPRLAILAIGLVMLVTGLYSLATGRPGIMSWQFTAEDRQTIRGTPVSKLQQAGLGATLFGIGAVIWSAVDFPGWGDLIGLSFVLVGLALMIVFGLSIPFTRRGRLLSGLVTFVTILVLDFVMYVVGWPNLYRSP